MELSLAGKVALVTGGSRGIGRAAALAFAQAGADVAVASRKIEDLEQVAEEIRGLGRKSLAAAAHMGRMDQIGNLVETVKKEFGRIDVLVNNAGTSPALSSVLDVEERLWDSIMNTNLKGLFFLSQAVARIMREHGAGSIINVASIDGLKPEKDMSVYSISKAGVIMATRAMALELGQYNIRVNAIAPGLILTKMGRDRFEAIPGDKEWVLSRTPLGCLGKPEDIATAMLYLASDASSFITGEILEVNGGILLT